MSVAQHERVARVEERHWWFVALREHVAALVTERVPPGGRVLDAGCGTGRVLAELPAGYERVGVDLDPGPLALARAREGIEAVAASVAALPFEDASFDAALVTNVLYHEAVPDDVAALSELRRVLRPGGVLVVHEPAYDWLRSAHDEVARTARRYTRRRLRAALAAAGLEVERAGYRVTLAFPLALVRRLLTRGGSGTDVGEVAAPLNAVLLAATRAEGALARRVSLPFGLSVVCVARAPGGAEGVARGLRGLLLRVEPLVALVKWAVTGEREPRRHRLLAEEVARGPHAFVVDLGCGEATLLRHVAPARYVGVDGFGPSLARARRDHAGPGREFVAADLATVDLTPWRGADVVTIASVTHHLPDGAVLELLERVEREVAPGRILLQDASETGPLGPLVRALDAGRHMRPREELRALLERRFRVRLVWSYDNPARSFHQFLFELTR